MRRVGNLYSKIYDMDNLRLAHQNARRGKGWYHEVKMINEEPETYLKKLQEHLINKTYDTSDYITFTKTEGTKVREIFKLPYYPDRICQWAIIQIIEPYFLKYITADTYSAIPGRGIHLALKKIRHAVDFDKEGTMYCLKLDVNKYYPSVNHTILKKILRRIFKDNDLLWLLDEIIDSTEGDTGIPIGNYMSQWFGNIYLARFDHWIKEDIGAKYYYRYMDDIVILHPSKEFLHDLLLKIKDYFEKELNLKVKHTWQVFPTAIRGIDFLGYRIFPAYCLLRKTTMKNMKTKVKNINKNLASGKQMNHNEWCSLNSYLGWLIWCNSYRLVQKYITPLADTMKQFYKEVVKNGAIEKRQRDAAAAPARA